QPRRGTRPVKYAASTPCPTIWLSLSLYSNGFGISSPGTRHTIAAASSSSQPMPHSMRSSFMRLPSRNGSTDDVRTGWRLEAHFFRSHYRVAYARLEIQVHCLAQLVH